MHELHVNSVYVWGGAAGGRFQSQDFHERGTPPEESGFEAASSKVEAARYTTKVVHLTIQLNILRKDFQNR